MEDQEQKEQFEEEFFEKHTSKKLGSTTKVIITGGHMTPALAVIDELAKSGIKNITWVGHKYSQVGDVNVSAEYKTITEKGIRFVELKAGKLFRIWNLSTLFKGLKSFIDIPLGFINAYFIVKKYKPDIIISFGGYLALPIVISAKLQKIKITTHEQTIIVGLANKWIAKFADKIFISWKESYKYFPEEKTVYSGNPIRKSIFILHTSTFRFSGSFPTIYVTGGNQGAYIINKNIVSLLPSLLREFNVVHQTGSSSLTHDYEKCLEIKDKLPEDLARRYIVKDYVKDDEIGEIFEKADVIISRAGANTCFELMALNKYSILIPIPWSSKGEQLKNAKALEEIGLSKILEEKDLSPENLNKMIYEILKYKRVGLNLKGKNMQNTAIQTQKLVKVDAAKIIVKESLRLLEK